ncbi:MAG TPA: SH3 domain-containing protein [Dehalococcoidia bacterium]|nr:SH3 domain-containing protein [Dehalococcoidia bacterium]
MLNNARPLFIAGGVFAFVFLVAIILVLLLGGGDGDDNKAEAQPTAAVTPEAPGSGPAEQALARYVQTSLSKGFVEDCAKAQVGVDVGKVCATFKGERGNQRAYILGLVASEPSQWAILEDQNGTWQVVHSPAITKDNASVPGVPWPLRTGVDIVVVGAAPCVNVREGPSINQKAVDCISDGTRIRLIAGPTPADNLLWWQVQGRTGWVVSDYLRYPDAAQ